MTRVRGFTQDDAHLFVTEDQLAEEVLGCIELVQIIFDKLGMKDYVRVGLQKTGFNQIRRRPKAMGQSRGSYRAASTVARCAMVRRR